MSCLHPVFFGRQFQSGYTVLDRHRHSGSYVALVLSGSYQEAGDRGAHQVRAGDAVMHGGFEAHLNRYGSGGAEVLTLALPVWFEPSQVVVRVSDPDQVVRIAERDPSEALSILLSSSEPTDRDPADWPQLLAKAIRLDPHLRLQEWARLHKIADATVSRGFRKVFGVSPSTYRVQYRARAAWARAIGSREALSSVAFQVGFSDQAHMTRAVQSITGQTPGVWRRRVK